MNRSRKRIGRVLLAAVTVGLVAPVLAVIAPSVASAATTASISSAGPLTDIGISDELNCSVNHAGDSAGEWFGETACGTLLASGGTLFGPSSIPAGGSASPRTAWTAVSQSAVTGSGTAASPYKVVTVVDGTDAGVRVTETDSYIVGEESYRTDVAIANTRSVATTAVLYRGGDCYLQDSDQGYGLYDASSGAVSCTTSLDPGSRIEQLLPITPGSRYVEGFYSSVWADMGSQAALPNTCDCATYEDNGIALSWDLSLAAGATKTFSSITTFSPLGNVPLTLDKTADVASVPAGGNDGYTITVTNNNIGPVTLSGLSDVLAPGFSYRPGTTTGATTADPTVSGQTLTWGPITVPAGGTASVHFGVTVSTAAGTYTDEANGVASGYTVIGTGPTAPVTVTPVAMNHPPVATPQSVATPQDTPVGVTLAGTDADGDALTFAIGSGPSHGSLSGSGANQTYTPDSGYTGPDSFTFTANDGQATSAPATVSITVTPVSVNHPPVATPQSVATPQDTPVGVTLAGTDADGDALTFAIGSGPSHGSLSGSGANQTYTPDSGYTGPDSFTFTANDGQATSAPATVSITVTPVSTCAATAPTLDTSVSANYGTPHRKLTSPKLTTASGGELILAFIEADGPYAPTQKVTGVFGGGLTWTRAVRSNATWGTTEVWQAYATAPLTQVRVTARLAKAGYDGSITVAAFSGAASQVGATAATSGVTGDPSATLTPTGCHSLVWAAGHDWTSDATPVAGPGQSLVNTFVDTRVKDSFWTQKVDDPTELGVPVTVGVTGPRCDRWTLAAVEILGVGSSSG